MKKISITQLLITHNCFIFLFALLLQSCGLNLVEDGKTEFTIVLPDAPQPVEQTAAKELKAYLDEMTQIDWVISSERDVPENAPQILIGHSSRAKKFFPEIDTDQIPYDGIELHLKGNKLLLTGHKQRGTLYAVNTFLEDILGVRWWSAEVQTVPAYKTFKLRPLNISYAPKLIYRFSYYRGSFEPLFATRMKCNAANIAPEYGDHHRFRMGHTFYPLIPPEKYFADHPEWFSEIDGVRSHVMAQLCLTNDEMRKELTKNLIETLRKNPGATFYSVAQNDWFGYCTCEKCSKLAEEEGAQSGPLIHFVNAVAEEVEKEFPDIYLATYAYQYTRKPPKHVKPRHNVVVQLCTIECSFVQPLSGPQNSTFYDDMVGWSKLTDQLFAYDYLTNFWSYILLHPNHRVVAPNIRFFVDHGTIGLFEEADSRNNVGDFILMRNWIASKLMWDPTLDENKLMREFLEGYYGKQATPILLAYFDTLVDCAEKSGQYINCFHDNTDFWLDYETLCQATALFDEAMAVARKESDVFVERLRQDRLPLEHVWIKGYQKFKRIAEQKGTPFCGPPDLEEAVRNFIQKINDYKLVGYRDYGEGKVLEAFKENYLHRFTPATTPDELKPLDAFSWMDIQEYDFWLRRVHFEWTSFVDDPAASNGRAVRLLCNRDPDGVICVQIPIDWDDPMFANAGANTKYKVIVHARSEVSKNAQHEIACGIMYERLIKSRFDEKDTHLVVQKSFDISTIAGPAYQKIELEHVPLSRHMYVYVDLQKEASEDMAVYIDRVMIVRE